MSTTDLGFRMYKKIAINRKQIKELESEYDKLPDYDMYRTKNKLAKQLHELNEEATNFHVTAVGEFAQQYLATNAEKYMTLMRAHSMNASETKKAANHYFESSMVLQALMKIDEQEQESSDTDVDE